MLIIKMTYNFDVELSFTDTTYLTKICLPVFVRLWERELFVYAIGASMRTAEMTQSLLHLFHKGFLATKAWLFVNLLSKLKFFLLFLAKDELFVLCFCELENRIVLCEFKLLRHDKYDLLFLHEFILVFHLLSCGL